MFLVEIFAILIFVLVFLPLQAIFWLLGLLFKLIARLMKGKSHSNHSVPQDSTTFPEPLATTGKTPNATSTHVGNDAYWLSESDSRSFVKRRPHEPEDFGRFYPELSDFVQKAIQVLDGAGIVWLTDYASLSPDHSTFGVEVCGINQKDVAHQILDILRNTFPDWKYYSLYYKQPAIEPGWKVWVFRDPEPELNLTVDPDR